MGKTINVASDRAFDQSKTVLPAEIARGVHLTNPPSLAALKLMHLMIATAGGRMADDVRHEIRLADIRSIEGMRNHDRTSLTPLFTELAAMVIEYDDPEKMIATIGGLMDEARIDYQNEASGDLLVAWWFGRAFMRMAADSNHWAILDRQTVFHLGSKYSVLLFQYISSLAQLDRMTAKTFTVPELRAVLGVPKGKLDRFSTLNAWAIQPAVAEINHLSRLTLTATPNKIGRTVASVTIGWMVKADQAPVKRELGTAKVGREARRSGAVETVVDAFPASGSISFGRWGDIARQNLHKPMRDIDLVAADFRKWASIRQLNLAADGVEKVFVGFCKKVGP